ncbi:MAG: pantoate--beta-alanine ligase [Bacteroidales bacterium]|nr:pantoate--beta-alanine ligase [Bacteroidales bacterium]
MKVFTTSRQVAGHYEKCSCKRPGFVPTMGALHEGHLSLVKSAILKSPMVAVSIFVNPTQFNDSEDLKKYPRTPEEDLSMLAGIMRENDFVFMPSVDEVYPGPDLRAFDFGRLDKVMEGLHRPGHFNGVAQVVSRLFDIIKPSYAFFGQKDFQQLTIIKELAKRSYPEITIVACPIKREKDGLAMSSRNKRLLPAHREKAGEIYKTLKKVAEMARHKEIDELKKIVSTTISKIPGFRLEYFEIADDVSLAPLKNKSEMKLSRKYYACIALFAGDVRLIDNLRISLR